MKTCVTLVACLVSLIVPSAVRAQDDDTPFPQPMYLIHITETGTMDGPRRRDDYMLYPQPPQNGILVTADGSGGTFTNKAELIGGPFRSEAEACRFAGGDTRLLGAIGCANRSAAAPATGGGIKAWWNRQSKGTRLLFMGGVTLGIVMLGMFLMSAAVTAAIASAATAASAFAEDVVATYLGGKVTKELLKRLVSQIGKI